MIRRMVPGVIASSATQINLFISAMLASQVAGMRVWLNIAERFYQLPLSLVGVAIGVALLPRLSTSFQTADTPDTQAAMDQAVVFGLALSLPAAAALMGMAGYLTDGFFTRGAFTSEDAANAAKLLFHYGWGVPAFVLIKILQPAFFARGDTRTTCSFRPRMPRAPTATICVWSSSKSLRPALPRSTCPIPSDIRLLM